MTASGAQSPPPSSGLIARFVDLKEAMEVTKVYMLQWHDMGQQPFASLVLGLYTHRSRELM